MTARSPIAALRESLTADRSTLHAAVDRVPTALRARRPAPDRWSVQDVLEHLAIIEGRAATLVRALIDSAPAADPSSAADPTAVDRTRLANRDAKVMAPDPIQPTGTMSADAALASLERSRADLLAALQAADGKDLSKVTRQHPALGTLDGYQWILAIGAHEMRHALQIDEIGQALRSS